MTESASDSQPFAEKAAPVRNDGMVRAADGRSDAVAPKLKERTRTPCVSRIFP